MADPPNAPDRPSIWAMLLLVVSVASLAVLLALVWIGL